MAKMFYTIEEAADKLGKNPDQVKQMAEDGQLQQFRDRDKVMFKVDQVDKLAGGQTGGETGEIPMAGGGSSEDTDAIDLAGELDTDHAKPKKPDEDAKSQTGVSVFDADEVDAADPMAQTVVSSSYASDEEDLALESVGSGSGLLDLTRESDDTSLGAELLEEIYPAGGSDEKMSEGGSGFEGIFDAAGGVESAPSGLSEVDTAAGAEPAGVQTVVVAEPHDPAGSGWTAGLLLGAFAALIIASVVVVTSMLGVTAQLTTQIAEGWTMWVGILAGGSLVLALIGLMIGKALGGSRR